MKAYLQTRQALCAAVSEHGAPNNFAATELAREYGAPRTALQTRDEVYSFQVNGDTFTASLRHVGGRVFWAVDSTAVREPVARPLPRLPIMAPHSVPGLYVFTGQSRSGYHLQVARTLTSQPARGASHRSRLGAR